MIWAPKMKLFLNLKEERYHLVKNILVILHLDEGIIIWEKERSSDSGSQDAASGILVLGH
jgi:hypothetical protein